MIAIVDNQLGNLRSIWHKITKLGFEAEVTSDPERIYQADKLILPGVGHFGSAVENLKSSGLYDVLQKAVTEQKKPILGICLGMQLLTEYSEEGDAKGLGWIPLQTTKFSQKDHPGLKVPHVGWSRLLLTKPSILFKDMPDESLRFYFTHSYRVHQGQGEEAYGSANATYGDEFVAVIEKDHIFGTQFHPEKSHKSGMKIIENFIRHS